MGAMVSQEGREGRADLVAGLTTAAVVLPKAMAFATIAGLPVAVGLVTALVPPGLYALLGSSPVLSVSSTTTLAILVASELDRLGDVVATPEARLAAAATLSLLVGGVLLVAALLRLGFVANFISESVLVGFKSGIGLVIVADQLPKLLGVHLEKAGFFRDLGALITRLPETSLPTLALSTAVIVLLLGLPRLAPRLPAPLVALAVAIALSAMLQLERYGVATVGTVPRGLPLPVAPRLELIGSLWPAALGIALMSFTESIAAARAFAADDDPRPRADRELLALGAANLAGGSFGAMAAGGGTSQTAVNRRAGARTRAAGLVTAAVALATLLVLAPLIGRLPQAALAAVVVVTSLNLIAPAEFGAIRRVRRQEFRWALFALAGVVLLGTLKGILVAVVISLLALAQQEMQPPVYELARKVGTDVFRPRDEGHPGDETWPGLLLVRTEGRLFFANAQGVADAIQALIARARPRPRLVVIDGRALIDLEYSALRMLDQAERNLSRQGITLALAGLNPGVLAMVRRTELGQRLGSERLFFNTQEAVERWLAAPEAVAGAVAGAEPSASP